MTDRPIQLLIFGASLRTGSYNVALADVAARAARQLDAQVELARFADFAVEGYDADREAAEGVPTGALTFAERLRTADAVIIASPEYNASMPGTVKNLIDWTSRLKPQPFWGKHGMLLSASPRMTGGNRGLWSLRVPLEHLGMRVFPEMFSLPQADQELTPEGELTSPRLARRLDKALVSFLELVEATVRYPELKP